MNETNFMRWIYFILVSLLFVFPMFKSEAATLKKLKGQRALISIDGTSMKEGDQFFTLDAAGKKRGLLRVTKIKDNQAVADVVKGKPEEGQTLSLAASAGSVGKSSPSASKIKTKSAPLAKSSSNFSHWGVLGSYLMNKMAVNFTVSGANFTTNMVGTGFGVLGTYNYDISSDFQIHGMGGLEQFQVSESCTALAACNANITYLSGYGIAKYNFIKGPTSAWAGGGLGFLYAVSKSSTVLDSSLITTNYVMTAAGGLEFDMGNGAYLPVEINYSLFPSSPTVTASYIALRVGWAWR